MELRNAIASEEDLFLMKSNNVFHKSDYTIHYRRYLSKNLFMFLTLSNSGLRYDTQSGILVNPKDFIINKNLMGNHTVTNNVFYLFNIILFIER